MYIVQKDTIGQKNAGHNSMEAEPSWALTSAVGKPIEGPAPGPDNGGAASLNSFIPFVLSQNSSEQPQARTGLDLSSTTSTILTPNSPTIKIPTGVKGPLPTGLVGIILGRISCYAKSYHYPGVIDSDYTEEIQIMISPPAKTPNTSGTENCPTFTFPYHTAVGHTATQNERPR